MRAVDLDGIQIDVVKRPRIKDALRRRARDCDMYRLRLAGYSYGEIAEHYRLSYDYVWHQVNGLPADVKAMVRKQFRGPVQTACA